MFNIRIKRLQFLRRDSVIATLLFLVSMGLFSIDWQYSLSNGNFNLGGGVSTVGAERVLNGDIPYRDFWTMYAPGHFYLLAILFKIFGNHLLVEVIAASVITAAAAVVIFLIGRTLYANQLYALIPVGVFLAGMFNTGYFKRLGSYSTAIFLLLIALYLIIRYYRVHRLRFLTAAGMMVGFAIIFKHDIAGYTAIALMVGLVVHNIINKKLGFQSSPSMWLELLILVAAILFISVPVMAYFAVRTWPDMLQNLVIFPLTDFRYSRPESYPGLLPIGLSGETPLLTLNNLFIYVSLNIVFLLALTGVIAVVVLFRKRQPILAAMGATFAVAYFLHYTAAHIQINTHFVTMAVYAFWLGILAYDLIQDKNWIFKKNFLRIAGLILTFGWFSSVVARPAYISWVGWQTERANINLPNVSGFNLTPDEAQTYQELVDFVNQHIPRDQALFVGLHRHDVVVIGDVMVYFILNRPIATRYQELHPAIADTQPVQQEIIHDIQINDLDYIILRRIFPDDVLNRVKAEFLINMPYVGATDLDEFIMNNYFQLEEFGPYTIWKRKTS